MMVIVFFNVEVFWWLIFSLVLKLKIMENIYLRKNIILFWVWVFKKKKIKIEKRIFMKNWEKEFCQGWWKIVLSSSDENFKIQLKYFFFFNLNLGNEGICWFLISFIKADMWRVYWEYEGIFSAMNSINLLLLLWKGIKFIKTFSL